MAAEGSNTRTEYPCNGKYRGKALIIVNHTFKDGQMQYLEDIQGAKHDVEMMEKLFKMLDFKVKVEQNKTAEEMKTEIVKAAKDKRNKSSDCFVLVICTHGQELSERKGHAVPTGATVFTQVVYGTDGKALDMNEILSNFEDSKSVGLAGKPKLFFIQACRSRDSGNPYDFGQQILVQENIPRYKKRDGSSLSLSQSSKHFKPNDATLDRGTEQKYPCNDQHSTDQTDQDEKLTDSSSPKKPQLEDLFKLYKDYDDIYEDWKDSEDECAEDKCNISASKGTSSSCRIAAKPGENNSAIPPLPFELVPIICPKDCLIVHPTASGKYAFYRDGYGSHLLYHMFNLGTILVEGEGLLKYLTQVISAMTKDEIFSMNPPENCSEEDKKKFMRNQPFKHCACIYHRLTSDVRLKPKKQNTFMAIVKKWLGK